MAVATDTFLKDTVTTIRNLIKANVTDPESATRDSGDFFVHTGFPKRDPVVYPIIIVQDDGIDGPESMGMQSELMQISLNLEIRVWARTVAERDSLSQDVMNVLRSNQYGSGSTSNDELHDFVFGGTSNISDEGVEGLKSKIIPVTYMFILGQ